MTTKEQEDQPINLYLPLKEINGEVKKQLSFSSSECQKLEETLAISQLKAFLGEIKITPKTGKKFRLVGKIKANYQRQSALSLDLVDLEIEEEFTAEFHPLHQSSNNQPEELELEFEEEMIEYYEGDKLNIGQVIYEQLVISLEEFPKKEGEVFQWKDEEEGDKDNPFAQLSTLKSTPK